MNKIVELFCICDEIVKVFNIKDDPQCKMSTSEVITFAISSALFFGCDYRKTRLILSYRGYFPKILSHSRIVRRIHQVPENVWYMIFLAFQIAGRCDDNTCFIVDSFPVRAYENNKSHRARIFSEKKYHGYTASKKMYFFGIKVHMIVDDRGFPIEFLFSPGSASDIKTLQEFSLQLPEGSLLLGDKAYTSYEFEDLLKERDKITMVVKRRKNLKRQNRPEEEFILSMKRNRIETAFSCIVRKMPRYIRARTEAGFCLKVFFCILAYMTSFLFCTS